MLTRERFMDVIERRKLAGKACAPFHSGVDLEQYVGTSPRNPPDGASTHARKLTCPQLSMIVRRYCVRVAVPWAASEQGLEVFAGLVK